jgi:hypothetical protein
MSDTEQGKGRQRRAYAAPRLMVYGDLRRLTAGQAGPDRDGGVGATKSKPSGGG